MNEVARERLKFYLRHQRHIDEWLKLPAEAAKLAHDFFASFAPQMGEGTTVKKHIGKKAGSDCNLMFYRPHWHVEKRYFVGILLSWDRERSGFIGKRRPRLGLLNDISRASSEGKDLRVTLIDALKQDGLLAEEGFSSEEWWPAVRRLPPLREDQVDALDGYRAQLKQEIEALLDRLSPLIDKVLSQRRRPGEPGQAAEA